MGWSGGSEVMSGVISSIKPRIKDLEDRKQIYREILDVLEGLDWDCFYECIGEDEAYDQLYRESYPDEEY